jgi:hypothetical protein
MTEGEPISVTDHLECRASGWNVDRSALNGTSAPLEHVKTHCPALIATLVAIAQAAKDNHEVDDQPRPTSSRWPVERTE